jgi:N-acetylmuramoyl-L-alanine amidase
VKKPFSVFLSLLLTFTLVLGTSLPAAAVTVTLRTATVNAGILNVRTGPAISQSRLATVSQGTLLPVIAEQPGWARIVLSDGRTGWVATEFVTLQNRQPAQWARVSSGPLNIRRGPGTPFEVLSTVSTGTPLPVIQNQNGWLQVRLASGQIGWVSSTYATLSSVYPGESTPAPKPAPQPTGTVNTAVLNVRSGPGTTQTRITTVNQNTQLVILQSQESWLQVRLPSGQTGWVSAEFVTLSQIPSPPAPAPSPIVSRPVQPEIRRTATVTASVLNVRSGPSAEATRVTTLSQGTMVDVIGEQNGWLQIRLASGQTGWISRDFAFVTTRQTGTLPGEPSPLNGRVIVLDPGHGGTNPGAVGVTGLYEKVVVLDVALRVADMLQAAGATVVMTRSGDATLDLGPRVSIAHSAGADVFVSIHANAHPNPAIGGTETYYYAYKSAAAQSQKLASQIQSELAGGLGLRNIGIKHGNFHVIRETNMPAALVELAFLSNTYEESLMRTDPFRQTSAEAIFRGLENYFR